MTDIDTSPDWETNKFSKHLDPVFKEFNIFDYEFSHEIWSKKYRNKNKIGLMDQDIRDTFERVAEAMSSIEKAENRMQIREDFYDIMSSGMFIPAGRILAGADTDKRVTLVNCFVNETLEDSMTGIMKGLENTALTMQMGGGMGTDFSTLRPRGARLKRTQSPASGPLPFMDMWDSMCQTIMSAGDRRGAMMGTLSCTHPDLMEFITYKQQPGKLRMFNISVLVSDAFMDAVRNDGDWDLYFHTPPHNDEGVTESFFDDNGVEQFIYSKHKARDIWNALMKSTYEYAEPGVIFMERVNKENNLKLVETIACTNPCVTGDTLVLTKKGHLAISTLVDESHEVWNGKQWSAVEPFSTGVNPLMHITFSNGQELKVTPYHGFYMKGQRVEAKDLQEGDKLDYADTPLVELPDLPELFDYSQGFYSGDGVKNEKHSKLYTPKAMCAPRLRGSVAETRDVDRGEHQNWFHGEMLPKDAVPINGGVQQCIEWLSGLLDADGCIERKTSSLVISLSSANKSFLQNIGLMLSRLGCNYRIWGRKDGGKKMVKGVEANFKNTYNLMLSMSAVHSLKELGLKCERLDLDRFWKPAGAAHVGNRIVSIKHLDEQEETFCFTEPMEHAGVFNGVHTANCGEQPLPPHGACNLGAINLAMFVRNPFTSAATFNFELLKSVVRIAMRFLDNVIDVSQYPLSAQQKEQQLKRRTGLGIMGLADMLVMMNREYDSEHARQLVDSVMKTFANAAYEASADLAEEYGNGSFPLYEQAVITQQPFYKKLYQDVQLKVAKGLRNGVLLTIAPTGTTAIITGNVGGSGEPFFAMEYFRKVLQADNSWKESAVTVFALRLWRHINKNPNAELTGVKTSQDLPVSAHINMQAVLQYWVDASISKTVNCPSDISFEDFQAVYLDAYEQGCKGCTTYRPSDVRGSVLSTTSDEKKPEVDTSAVQETLNDMLKPRERPKALGGQTYKLKWPLMQHSIYMTVNDDEDGAFEVFFNTRDTRINEWLVALSVTLTAMMRQGHDIMFLLEDLEGINSLTPAWLDGTQHKSLISYIANTIRSHIQSNIEIDETGSVPFTGGNAEVFDDVPMTECSSCGEMSVVVQAGCKVCTNCGDSKCG